MTLSTENTGPDTTISLCERTGIVCTAAVAIPAVTFFIAWWSSAALYLYTGIDIGEQGVKYAALSGLAVGVIADVFLLRVTCKRWYTAPVIVPLILYFFFSIIAYAVFMGLPTGVLFTGILAGAYKGRRHKFLKSGMDVTRQSIHRFAIITALVTGGFTLLSAVLVITDQSHLYDIRHIPGLPQIVITQQQMLALIISSVPVLSIMQYCMTRATAFWAHRL